MDSVIDIVNFYQSTTLNKRDNILIIKQLKFRKNGKRDECEG